MIRRQLTETPDESMETAYQKVRKELAQELLKQIKQMQILAFFEKLVIDLLVKNGRWGHPPRCRASRGPDR